MERQQVAVSIVVPTRDRPSELARCLGALALQETSVPFEVIVVDDGSAAPDAVSSAVAGRATIVRCPALGPAAARNAGVDAAAGNVVCFVDDDCIPQTDWAERLGGAIEAGAVAVAGRTVNGRVTDPLAEASQLVANSLMTDPYGPPRRLRFAPTSNLCCARDLLLEIPFDAGFSEAAGEDRDWCVRMLACGHELWFEPAAVVAHWPTVTLRSFWRQHVRYGRGAYAFRQRHAKKTELELPQFYLQLVRRAFGRGARVGVLVLLAQAATACGFVVAWRRDRTEVGKVRRGRRRGRR